MKCSVFVVCAYLFIILNNSEVSGNENGAEQFTKLPHAHKISKEKTTKGSNHHFWFTDLPLLPVVIGTSKTIPDGECKSQLKRYSTDLQNGLYWATQMFDSSEKYPYGIIDGSNKFFGNFDQCYRLNVQVPNESEDDLMNIKGRYCFVDLHYERENFTKTEFRGQYTKDFDPTSSALESIEENGDFRRAVRNKIQLALCVPAACSAEDIETALISVYDEFSIKNNLKMKVLVESRNCQTKDEEPEFTNAARVYCAVIIASVILVIAGTRCDNSKNAKEVTVPYSKAKELLLCFSVHRNVPAILQVKYNHPALDAIHMMKFMVTCLAVLGHRVVLFCYLPLINKRYLEETINMKSMVLIHNGTATVGVFFALGGLLTCYGCLEYLNKNRRFPFLSLILGRLIRLTPGYIVTIFFYVTIFPHFGTGPFWKSDIIRESEYCTNNWWTNLLYVNNYIKGNELCIFQSWYLSADFQCFVLSLGVIYVFWRLPRKIGYLFCGLCILGSSIYSFYITYVYKTQPTFMGRPYLNNILEDSYFVDYYIKPDLHLTSYLIGVLTGAIIYDCNSVTYRMSKVWSNITTILTPFALCISALYIGHKYFDPNLKPTWLEIALYSTIHRAVFSAGFCSACVLMQIGTGLEWFRSFLTISWIQPLSRLSFGVYLTHGFIHLYEIGTMRTMRMCTLMSMFWNLVPDLFFSYIMSFALAICIEGPCNRMRNVLMSKSKEKNSHQKSAEEVTDGSKKTT